MIEIVVGVVCLVALVVVALWLLGLPEGDDEEELAGLIAGNWDEVERRADGE